MTVLIHGVQTYVNGANVLAYVSHTPGHTVGTRTLYYYVSSNPTESKATILASGTTVLDATADNDFVIPGALAAVNDRYFHCYLDVNGDESDAFSAYIPLHVRSRIKQYIGYQVFSACLANNYTGLLTPLPFVDSAPYVEQLPAVVVRAVSNTPDYSQGMQSSTPLHTLGIEIDIYTQGAEKSLTEDQDEIAREIEEKIYNDQTCNGLAVGIEIGNTTTETDTIGDQPVSLLRQEYSVLYYLQEGAPQTAIT